MVELLMQVSWNILPCNSALFKIPKCSNTNLWLNYMKHIQSLPFSLLESFYDKHLFCTSGFSSVELHLHDFLLSFSTLIFTKTKLKRSLFLKDLLRLIHNDLLIDTKKLTSFLTAYIWVDHSILIPYYKSC